MTDCSKDAWDSQSGQWAREGMVRPNVSPPQAMTDGPTLVEEMKSDAEWLRCWERDTQGVAHAIADRIERARDEIERLINDYAEETAIRERLAELLAKTTIALKGPEPRLTRWSYHDIPELVLAQGIEIELKRERIAALEAELQRVRLALERGQGCILGLLKGTPVRDVSETLAEMNAATGAAK